MAPDVVDTVILNRKSKNDTNTNEPGSATILSATTSLPASTPSSSASIVNSSPSTLTNCSAMDNSILSMENNNDKLTNGVYNRKNVLHKNNANNHTDSDLNDAIDGFVRHTNQLNNNLNSNKKNNNNNNNNNNSNCDTNHCDKNSNQVNGKLILSPMRTATDFVPKIRWPDLIVQIFLHTGAIYGLMFQFYKIKIFTFVWFLALIAGSGFGITAGAHRLWSHKAYKAKWQLRLLLTFLFTISGQRDAYTWAHDHRVHHKYSETDADPHDARRGFFFAHVAWLFLTPHPEVVAKRKIIDMSDLESDRIVMWQKWLYEPLFAIIALGMPVLVPWYFWNEDLWVSFWVNFNLRFCITLNIAFFVNSVAHMYGTRPYDKNISPAESLPVAIAAFGEGWHNYHHVFPWDYKTGELGSYKYNVSTAFIDFFSKVGWAYDRKYVSPEMIARRAAKCGDGTHFLDSKEVHENAVWGVGDKDICQEDLNELENMRD